MMNQNWVKEIPDMGVIWVLKEAAKLGFYNGSKDWANLGQGQPEFGEMEGAPPRIKELKMELSDNAYGPLNGTMALRETIANHYNRLYRKGKASQYTAENVSVAMGGRMVLTQVCTMLGNIRLGYKIPEYPAYADILSNHKGRLTSIHIPTVEEHNFGIPAKDFSAVIKKYALDSFLVSNPCNPTGNIIAGDDLHTFITTANNQNCALIIDEMYSHYIFEKDKPAAKPVSASEYIEYVNEEAVVIVDGLTKSFRYPGWRLAWAIGPSNLMNQLNRVASSINGGPSQPMQRAAIAVLQPDKVDQETTALRKVFSLKHNMMLERLRASGIQFSTGLRGTFYLWGNISQLPKPLNQSEHFFTEALKHQVITVPGHLFDIHPGNIKSHNKHFNNYVRFSFGPEEENIKLGISRLEAMIQQAST